MNIDNSKRNPLELFLLDYFQINEITKLDPFAKFSHGVESWKYCKLNVCDITINASGYLQNKYDEIKSTLKEGVVNGGNRTLYPRNVYKDKQTNLNNVCVNGIYAYNIDATEMELDCKGVVYGCLNYYDKNCPEIKEYDDISHNLGGIAGAIFQVVPGKKNQKQIVLFQSDHTLLHFNDYFRKTTFHLTRENIKNGIIKLPINVVKLCDFPVNEPVKVTGATYVFQTYYLIPYNHVIAWPLQLQMSELRISLGFYAEPIRICGKIMYYAVGDACYEYMYKQFNENFIDKLHKQKLGDVGINWVLSKTQDELFNFDVSTNVKISYISSVVINPEEKKSIIPTLSPDFIKFEEIYAKNLERAKFDKLGDEEDEKIKDEKMKQKSMIEAEIEQKLREMDLNE